MSKITDRIENGQDIKNMNGFLRVEASGAHDGKIYIPVTVLRIGIEQGRSCGLTIIVRGKGGIGELSVSPCQILDSKTDVDKAEKRAIAFSLQKTAYRKIRHWTTIAGRRRELAKFIDAMKGKPLARVKEELADSKIEDHWKMPQELIDKIAEIATKAHYEVLDVNEDEDDDDY